MRQREKVQAMLRGQRLVCGLLVAASLLCADHPALWKEYGLVQQQTSTRGRYAVTTYRMKDLTGALAAWESLRSPNSKPCDLVQFCTIDGNRTVISSENYVIVFEGPVPKRPAVEDVLQSLPEKRDSSLPAILTFLPQHGRLQDSARYVLGPVSLAQFAPELASSKPGFEQSAEAQVAAYRIGKIGPPVRLALFYYATPEMARIHAADFKKMTGVRVKRSGVLVAVVLDAANDEAADTLLSRVGYEAKITWNEVPPPSPIKPLYQLLANILYLSGILSALCLAAGLVYAFIRIYRRRYGTLEADEALTILNLSGGD